MMPDTYAIIGFSNSIDDPVVMFESNIAEDCDRWRKGYTRFGDWGGYDCLSLYEISPDQSALFIHKSDAPIISWECPDEPFETKTDYCERMGFDM